MSQPTKIEERLERVYTIEQLCEIYGVSRQYWWRAIKSGRIGHQKHGVLVRISQSQLDAYLALCDRPARPSRRKAPSIDLSERV